TRLPLPSMLQYPAHPEYHTLSLHDALPIFIQIDGQFWAEGTEEQRIQLNAGALHTENAKTVELRYADLVGTGVQSGDLNSINMTAVLQHVVATSISAIEAREVISSSFQMTMGGRIYADRVVDSQFSANSENICYESYEYDEFGNWSSSENCYDLQHNFSGWLSTVLNSEIRYFEGSISNAQNSVLASSRLQAQRIQNSTLTSVTLRPEAGSIITHNTFDQSSRFESYYGNTPNVDLRF